MTKYMFVAIVKIRTFCKKEVTPNMTGLKRRCRKGLRHVKCLFKT